MSARAALVGTLALLTLACSSPDSPNGPSDVPGTYVLRTIEGSLLPYTVPNTVGNTVVVNSATATLGDSGTYAVAGTGTISGVVNTVLTDNGAWVQNGDKVNFTSEHITGAFYFARAKKDTLTLTLPGGFLNSTNGTFSLLFVRETP